MAYADQSMSTRKVVSIGAVVALHALLGYAFITGLAYNVVAKVAEDLKTFDVVEEAPPPPDEPPPPPPDQPVEPPPVVAPPPIVQTPVTIAPPVTTVQSAPPVVITPTAPPAPPPPPAPPAPKLAQKAQARGNRGAWVTNDDYPSAAVRDEREGVSAVAWDVTTDGRVANCRVTSSSGSPDLDDAACKFIMRRARYKPAQDDAGNPIASTDSQRVRWVLPE